MAKFSKKQITAEMKKARASVEIDFQRGAINVFVRVPGATKWDANAHRLGQVAAEAVALKLRLAALLEDVHLDAYSSGFGQSWPASACLGPVRSYDSERIVTRELCTGDNYEAALETVARVVNAALGEHAVAVNWSNVKAAAHV